MTPTLAQVEDFFDMNRPRPAIGGDALVAAEILKLRRRVTLGTIEIDVDGESDRLVHPTNSHVLPSERDE